MRRNNRSRRGYGGNRGFSNDGDWSCPKCGYSNFRRNGSCRQCGTRKGSNPSSNSSSNASSGHKAADWKCSFCNGHNFAHRQQCYTCKRAKQTSNASSKSQFGKGGSNDNNNNNSSNKSGISGISSNNNNNDKQPGWQCNNCLNFNSSDGLLCRVCNNINANCKLPEAKRCFETQFITSIDGKKRQSEKGKEKASNDDEWLCSRCGTKNRSTRARCFNKKCNELRLSNDDKNNNNNNKSTNDTSGSKDIKMKNSSNNKDKEKKTQDIDMENEKTIVFAKGCKAIVSGGGKVENIDLDVENTTFAIKVSWNTGRLTGFASALFENETSAVLGQQILSKPIEYRIAEARNLAVFEFNWKRHMSNFDNKSNYIEKDEFNEGIYKLKLKLPQNMQREDKMTDELLTIELSKILDKGIKQQQNQPLVKCQFIEAKVFRKDGASMQFGNSSGGGGNTKEYNLSVLKSIFDKYNCEKIRVNDTKFGVGTAIISFESVEDAMAAMKDYKDNKLVSPPAKFCYSRKLTVQFDLRCVLEVANPFIYSCLKAEIDRLMYDIRRNKLKFGNTKIFLFQFESRIVICGNNHEAILFACKLYKDLIEPTIIQFKNEIIAFLTFNNYLKVYFQKMYGCVIQGPPSLNENENDNDEKKNEDNNNNNVTNASSSTNRNEIRIYSTKQQRHMIEESIKQFEQNNIECKVVKVKTPQFIRVLMSQKHKAMLTDWRNKHGIYVRCDISTKTIELYRVSFVNDGAKDSGNGLDLYAKQLEELMQQVEKSTVVTKDKVKNDNMNDNGNDVMCGVCFMGFEDDEQVIKLTNCGHCAHTDCFELQMQASGQPGGTRPIKCAECSKMISLKDISSILKNNEDKVNKLLKLSVDDYVDTHPNVFGYCPTPDCGAIYKKCSANANDNTSGSNSNSNSNDKNMEEKKNDNDNDNIKANIYSCQECLRQYCLNCLKDGVPVSYHFGLTCKEYSPYINEDESFAKFMTEYTKNKDTKKCPSCGMITDKFKNTCNHATCVYCKVHFCWKCLWFDKKNPNSGNVIYTHMNRKHGGWYH